MDEDRLHRDLIKLADIMETCEPGSAEFKEYNREYKNIAKQLFPQMYKKSVKKEFSKYLKTLTNCTCGCKTIKVRKSAEYQICCNACDRQSEVKLTLPEVRDSWNSTFKTI